MSISNGILYTNSIQQKRGTSTALAASSYIPLSGEIIIATDTGELKVGDGVHPWSDLLGISAGGGDSSAVFESRLANIEQYLDITASGISGTQSNNLYYHETNLGEFTPELSAKIRAGDFTDIYPGCYHQFTDVEYSYDDGAGGTITGTYTGIMRYMDLDYFYGYFGCNTHHFVVFPDDVLYKYQMNGQVNVNSTATTEGGYVHSLMKATGLKRAEAIFKACFGEEHLLVHKEFLVKEVTNGVSSGGIIADCLVELPDERMLFGAFQNDATKNNPSAFPIPLPNSYGQDNPQFAAMRFNAEKRYTGKAYRERNVSNNLSFCSVSDANHSIDYLASFDHGVRPYATIY